MAASPAAAQTIYQGNEYQVTDTSVVQGTFRAVAESRTRITSNYQRERTAVNFKFSLNGRNNERLSGDDRRLRLDPVGGLYRTPVYVFGGRPDEGFPQPEMVTRRADTDAFEVVFRVDLRPVLRSFRENGVYDPPVGEPIQEEDFEGVTIVGDTDPLVWDTQQAWADEDMRFQDPDGDGVYHLSLQFARRDLRPLNDRGKAVWSLTEDVSDFPQYTSDQRLVDALYTLSLEETLLDIREDGAFMAGKKWTGVWTRDISYSILLSLALVKPESAKTSLRAKVTEDGRIIQDTGTGGSWPVSSDRMTWALAAWETYLTTGDDDWLQESYDIIRRSAVADLRTVVDSTTGLVHGESSFMDWREQSYPDWMDPKDIYRSQTLSTNVVHYRTYRILAQMAEQLGEPSQRWEEVATSIREGINEHLWMPTKGHYSVFRYGRNHLSRADRAEGLGASLAILTGVADGGRAEVLAEQQPVVEFGTPSFWPYIPGIPPYHNAGIWPFVSSYWTWASAEAQNTAGVEHGLASIYRAAALFLTNKENMVAQTGHFEGTQINSDRQLWSVAGNLATVYRVLYGMRFTPEGLHFRPFVPEGYSGTHTLEGVEYRDATLDIELRGHGHRIVQITLDGEPLDEPLIPADLSGEHEVRIVLNGGLPEANIHLVPNRYTPATPQVQRDAGGLVWDAIDGAASYRVVRNGTVVDTTASTRYAVSEASTLAEYQVQAVGVGGLHSFLSEPVRVVEASSVTTVQPAGTLETEHDGYTGDGYLPLRLDAHRSVTMEVEVETPGLYSLDVRYANGSGPVNTDNKAAIRTLRVDGDRVGPIVLPQRGPDRWSDWGYSNPQEIALAAGTHTVTLVFTNSNRNMNGTVNAANLDHVRLTRLKAGVPGDESP